MYIFCSLASRKYSFEIITCYVSLVFNGVFMVCMVIFYSSLTINNYCNSNILVDLTVSMFSFIAKLFM